MTRIAVTLVFDVNSHAADTLPADPGWAGPDGDYEPPRSGLEVAGDTLAQHQTIEALRHWGAPLDAMIDHTEVAVLAD